MKEPQVFEKPKFISPKEVLKEIGLETGDIVVDYGSGSGYWAIAAAEIVAPKGMVYAVEDRIEILHLLKNLAEIRKLTNIEIQEINIENDQPEIEKKADLVVIANVLHSTKNKQEVIERAGNILKDKGMLLIVDWLNEKTLFGPPAKFRLKPENIMSMAEKVGFGFNCTVEAGWHHFGMLFEKGGRNAEKK
jgi:predicted methyltransferase